MSRIARGYGSEFHLLRYLGYHRHALKMAVGHVVGAEVEWYDVPFSPNLLAYLHRHGVRAHLLFIYFTGEETFPNGRSVVCPKSGAAWAHALKPMYDHVGWDAGAPLAAYVHQMYLPMHPSGLER